MNIGDEIMSFISSVLLFLDAKMETPEMYGWFHLMFWGFAIISTLLLCRFMKPTEKNVNRMFTIMAITLIVLEVYKQVNYTFSVDGSIITSDYQWYAFPFQFCDTPTYTLVLAAILRRGRVYKGLCAFTGTFALFAGISVMLYPSTVFTRTIGVNIHTMVWHASMIPVGLYLLWTGYVKTDHKTVLRAVPVFLTAVSIAAIMNEIAFRSGLLETDTFNMFYISPYCDPHLPVYSIVQQYVPFPWCLGLYVLGFSAAAYIVLLIVMFIKKLARTR